jgi:hypothetical protein
LREQAAAAGAVSYHQGAVGEGAAGAGQVAGGGGERMSCGMPGSCPGSSASRAGPPPPAAAAAAAAAAATTAEAAPAAHQMQHQQHACGGSHFTFASIRYVTITIQLLTMLLISSATPAANSAASAGMLMSPGTSCMQTMDCTSWQQCSRHNDRIFLIITSMPGNLPGSVRCKGVLQLFCTFLNSFLNTRSVESCRDGDRQSAAVTQDTRMTLRIR